MSKELISQQRDFIRRLQSGAAILSKLDTSITTGCFSESTKISGRDLDEIRDYCWKILDKYFLDVRNKIRIESGKYSRSEGREFFIRNMIGKIGEATVKRHLDDLIDHINFDVYEKIGDGGFDFRLLKKPAVNIQVKTRMGLSCQNLKWQLSDKEKDINEVLICLWIKENVSETQPSFEVVNAGFIPTKGLQNKRAVRINDLYYSGGLRSYLDSLCEKDIPETKRNDFHQEIKKIQASLEAGNFEIAISRLEQLESECNTATEEIYILKSRIFLRSNDFMEAVNILSEAIKELGESSVLYFCRGIAWAHLVSSMYKQVGYKSWGLVGYKSWGLDGYVNFAIQDFEKAISINPNHVRSYIALSKILTKFAMRSEAFRKALEAEQIARNFSCQNELDFVRSFIIENFSSELEAYVERDSDLNISDIDKEEVDYDDIPF